LERKFTATPANAMSSPSLATLMRTILPTSAAARAPSCCRAVEGGCLGMSVLRLSVFGEMLALAGEVARLRAVLEVIESLPWLGLRGWCAVLVGVRIDGHTAILRVLREIDRD